MPLPLGVECLSGWRYATPRPKHGSFTGAAGHCPFKAQSGTMVHIVWPFPKMGR